VDLHIPVTEAEEADKPKVLEAYITDEMKKRIDECTWLPTRDHFGTEPA